MDGGVRYQVWSITDQVWLDSYCYDGPPPGSIFRTLPANGDKCPVADLSPKVSLGRIGDEKAFRFVRLTTFDVMGPPVMPKQVCAEAESMPAGG